MGLFSDYVKKSMRIGDKRITVNIQNSYFESRYGFPAHFETDLEQLALKLEANENTKFLIQLNQRPAKEIKTFALNFIWEAFFKAIGNNLHFIKTDNLLIYIKIRPFPDQVIAQYIGEISTENIAFFDIDTKNLLYNLYCSYFKKNLEGFVNYFRALPYSFYELIVHEFTHHIDRMYGKMVDKISERIVKSVPLTGWLYKDRSDPNLIFIFVSNLRSEGIAVLNESRNKGFVIYKIEIVKRIQEVADNYINNRNRSLFVHFFVHNHGYYMAFFIGLAYLYRHKREVFNNMRVYFDNEDFLFLAEGLSNLMDKQDILKFQNIPREYTDELIHLIMKLSHISFIKEYEEACKTLNIPEKHVIITLLDYKKMKRVAYEIWLEEVKKEGFSPKGIKATNN